MQKTLLVRGLTSVFFILCFGHYGYSQGCSDAGFCTMGAMKPNQPFSKKVNLKLRSIDFSSYIGVNKIGDVITSYTADVTIGITPKYSMQVKVPYMIVYGVLGNTNGLSDISLSASRNIIAKEKYQLNFSLGAKIPTNNSDLKSEDGLPLPNYYQTSLGTYDAIAGISFITKKWLIATGYQQPLNGNKNQFVWGPWKNNEAFEIAKEYPISKNLKRGNDIMLRVERNFRFSRFNSHIGLLGIYRITEDEFASPTGLILKEKETTGLVVSAIAGFGYHFSARSAINFIFGARVYINRYDEVDNPLHLSRDGLSRNFVNTIGYQFRF